MDDFSDSSEPFRVAVKPSAVDGNSDVEEITGRAGTVLTFDSREAAETKAARLSNLGDRSLSLQQAAPQDTSDIDVYLISRDGPGRRWECIRATILERDCYTCQRCGTEKGEIRRDELDVHHKTARSEGGSDTPANLTTWCKDCHQHVHAEEKRRGTLAELQADVEAFDDPMFRTRDLRNTSDVSQLKYKLPKLVDRWDDLAVLEAHGWTIYYRLSAGIKPEGFQFTHDSWRGHREFDADDPFRDANILRGPVFYENDLVFEGWAGRTATVDELFQCPVCEYWYIDVGTRYNPIEDRMETISVEKQLESHQERGCPGPRLPSPSPENDC